VCTLISHVILDAPAAAAAFYVALGGTQQPDSSHLPRINAGNSHLRLESQQATSSQEPREWAGHIELWTTEPLETLHNRLSALDDSISPPPQSLVLHGDESPDPRVLCTCPWGNKFIIRLAPAAHEVRGEPPGGCGTLVAISRVVRKVGPGMAEGIHAFWVGILGSLSELRATSDRSISFVIAHMASGQQIIWEERREAELDELQPEATPSQADGRDGGTALEVLERTGITIYLQSREAFRSTFMAGAAKGLLLSSSAWDDAESSAEYCMLPSLAPRSRTQLDACLIVRSIAHPECPRFTGRRVGTGRMPGGFGPRARELASADKAAAAAKAPAAASTRPGSGGASKAARTASPARGRAASPKPSPRGRAASPKPSGPAGPGSKIRKK